MRVLVSVVGDTLVTAAPPEPILAVAAAAAVTMTLEDHKKAYRTLLTGLIQKGLVLDTGEQGELCSRLLVLLTRDMATLKFRSTFVVDEERDARINVISLREFFTTLLAANDQDVNFGFGETELAAELAKFCDEKWINMTHFIKFGKSVDELTLGDLEYAWFTGAAIQFAHNQPVLDGGLVVYCGPLDEPYNRHNLLFVPYQTKARKNSAGKNIGEGLTAPPILHPDGRRVKNPTVVLLMDLGATRTIQRTGRMTMLKHRAAQTTKNWKGYADPSNGEREPENFFLNIRGCSPVQYPVLNEFEDTFASLFSRSLKTQLPNELKAMEIEMTQAMYPIGEGSSQYSGLNDSSKFDLKPLADALPSAK